MRTLVHGSYPGSWAPPEPPASLRSALHIMVAGLLWGCGSGKPEIPPELLATSGGCGAPSYPSGPFGSEEGDTVENACFSGFRAPDAIDPSPERLETLAFSDFYDPQGTRNVTLLMINTAAVWCGACLVEHETLHEWVAMYEDQGLVVLSTLFQDVERQPATVSHLEAWVERYRTNFPMALDPELVTSRYASTELAPLNMIVDPRDMTILRKFIGDQPQVMWPYIADELQRRAGSE